MPLFANPVTATRDPRARAPFPEASAAGVATYFDGGANRLRLTMQELKVSIAAKETASKRLWMFTGERAPEKAGGATPPPAAAAASGSARSYGANSAAAAKAKDAANQWVAVHGLAQDEWDTFVVIDEHLSKRWKIPSRSTGVGGGRLQGGSQLGADFFDVVIDELFEKSNLVEGLFAEAVAEEARMAEPKVEILGAHDDDAHALYDALARLRLKVGPHIRKS